MLTAFLAVLPAFAIIGAGWLTGRLGGLGPAASSELNRFVIWLALPALLFQTLAEADWAVLWQPGFAASFLGGGLAVMAGTLIWRMRRGERLAGASLNGLSASYANVGYLGFAIGEPVFGRGAFPLISIAIIMTAGVMFAVAVVLLEVGSHAGAHPLRVARRVAGSVLRNPIVMAPVLGGAWAALGIAMPPAGDMFLHMLGAAASPCALVAIGLFFAQKAPAGEDSPWSLAIALTLAKLVAHPLAVGLLAWLVFGQSRAATGVAVLTAALPTGTGAFMLAHHYRVDVRTTSRAILLSTALSVATLTLLVMGLRAWM